MNSQRFKKRVHLILYLVITAIIIIFIVIICIIIRLKIEINVCTFVSLSELIFVLNKGIIDFWIHWNKMLLLLPQWRIKGMVSMASALGATWRRAPHTGIFWGFYGKVIWKMSVRYLDRFAISVLAISAIFRRYTPVLPSTIFINIILIIIITVQRLYYDHHWDQWFVAVIEDWPQYKTT